MIHLIIPLLLAIQSPGRLPPAQAVPPPESETASVLAPIEQLFVALAAGDSAGVLGLVYPDGRVTATGTRASSSGLRKQIWEEFAAGISPASAFRETISDPAVEVDGDIAMVWAPFVVRVGGKVSNCGIDHFDLVRDKGEWRLMNLTFSSRTTGCLAE